MYQGYANDITLATDQTIPFVTTDTNCLYDYNDGVITIKKSGKYRVSINGYGSTLATSGTGLIGMQVFVGGVAVETAKSEAATTNGNPQVLSIDKVVNIKPYCIAVDPRTISVKFIGGSSIMNLITIEIVRIDNV